MRLVVTAVAFIAGVVFGTQFGFEPEGFVSKGIWLTAAGSCLGFAAALALASRNPIAPLLVFVALLGIGRGADAVGDIDVATSATGISIPPIVDSVRTSINETVSSLVAGDPGALGIAMLTGQRDAISDSTVDAFRGAGLSHLLAISGLHIALVGGMTMNAAAFALGKRGGWYLLPVFASVLVYAGLSGLAPPVIRAAIMFGIFVVARIAGRSTMLLPAVALAGLVMVAANPALVASISFQLSFAAMVGIAAVVPKLDALTEVSGTDQERNRGRTLSRRAANFVKGSITVSVAATVATAPLVGMYFGGVPVWGVLSTLLALPAIPVLVVATALAALVGSTTASVVADWSAMPVWLVSSYVIEVATAFNAIPFSQISNIRWTPTLAVGYYVVVGVVILTMPYARQSLVAGSSALVKRQAESGPLTRLPRSSPYWMTGVLFVAAASMFALATFNSVETEGDLTVSFITVESGESIFVTTPHGNRLLIDAGVNPTEVADKIAADISPFDRKIDLVILTHPDADHVGGMPEVLRRFDVDVVMHTGEVSTSDAFGDWETVISSHESVAALETGTIIGLDSDVFIEVLAAGCPFGIGRCPDINDTSAVLRLVYREVSLLLTGDIESAGERRLLHNRLPISSTVLKVPHHGSTTSSTEEFIAAVAPQVAVFAVGYGPASDRFGHPAPEVYRRIASFVPEPHIFRTDTQGTVKLITDGERLWRGR